MRVGEHRDALVARVRMLNRGVIVLLAAIAASFWFVQVVQGSRYRELAENNRLRKLLIRAPRGLIYDRQGRPLVENVPSYDLLVDRSRSGDLAGSLEFAAAILERPPAELRTVLERYRGVPSFSPVLLAENLSLAEVARFGAHGLEHPEFEIAAQHLRLYRHGEQTAHVLGYLGEAAAEDLQRAGHLQAGDLVGKKGVERRYDQVLRGGDGERVVVVDSRGRPLEERVGRPARPGRDLALTLDLELQQAAARALGERAGAVVAFDPRDGAVRVLLSTPAFNPNAFARRLHPEDWQRLLDAPHQPLQNRALQSSYSPGSVFKIVVATAGLAEGEIGPGDAVWCGGSARIYGRQFRCWKREGHGWVDLHRAIKGSCDVYFYRLGDRLGIERIAAWSRRFGLGEATGLDLAGERSGLVPDPQWKLRARREPWFPGETISVAIGQGPVLVTPVQLASLMATVANGGRRVTPHLVAGSPAPAARALEVPGAALERVRRALWAVVNDGGTGAGARVPDLEIAGKTATVQVVEQKSWIDSHELPEQQRDHAWFASYAPAAEPRLVVVVFVEHGGRGSQAAAPVAKAVYESYLRSDLGHRDAS